MWSQVFEKYRSSHFLKNEKFSIWPTSRVVREQFSQKCRTKERKSLRRDSKMYCYKKIRRVLTMKKFFWIGVSVTQDEWVMQIEKIEFSEKKINKTNISSGNEMKMDDSLTKSWNRNMTEIEGNILLQGSRSPDLKIYVTSGASHLGNGTPQRYRVRAALRERLWNRNYCFLGSSHSTQSMNAVAGFLRAFKN